MKSLLVLALLSVLYAGAFAQKYVPVIKEGSVITYDAYSVSLGQHIPLVITIKSLGDPVKIQWDIEGYGTGNFEIPAKAIESATKLVIKQPDPDGVTKMKDNETLLVLSRTLFNAMMKDKTFELNSQKYTVASDTATYKINNKPADVYHAISDNGKSEVWVLNNPTFPLVYRAKSVTRGVDFTLTGIKE
ncbi:MAG: hypothetical protein M3N14_04745 [Bacteroidota bacterium]|nr:hypothetical protein [Bacteroidota bacterium]